MLVLCLPKVSWWLNHPNWFIQLFYPAWTDDHFPCPRLHLDIVIERPPHGYPTRIELVERCEFDVQPRPSWWFLQNQDSEILSKLLLGFLLQNFINCHCEIHPFYTTLSQSCCSWYTTIHPLDMISHDIYLEGLNEVLSVHITYVYIYIYTHAYIYMYIYI